MSLLLDEHLSPKVADGLRARGHDVTSVSDDPERRGMDDLSLLRLASVEGRALVTEDAKDLVRLAALLTSGGEHHAGLVVIGRRSLPRHEAGVGRLIRALEHLAQAGSADEALADQVVWLSPAPGDDEARGPS